MSTACSLRQASFLPNSWRSIGCAVALRALLTCEQDAYYDNGHWARMGGISLAEMNVLEVRSHTAAIGGQKCRSRAQTDFLVALQFELYVSTEVYVQYEQEIVQQARRICQTRGKRLSSVCPPGTVEETAMEEARPATLGEPPARDEHVAQRG